MPQLYVATNGLSVWKSADLGASIERMPSGTGLYSGSQVWALARHPALPGILFAGTDSGLWRLDAARARWTHLPSPMDAQRLVTAIALAPDNPEHMLVGTQPSALFRSDDAGRTWQPIETAIRPYTTSGFLGSDAPGFTHDDSIKHWTRVTQIVIDPDDPRLAWAGVEIDGLWRSVDGGRRWTRTEDGLETDDIHGLAVMRNGARTVFATTNAGLHVSDDDGVRWRRLQIDSPWQYVRSIAARPDGVMFMTNGNGPPGTGGKLFRSRDRGGSWQEVALPARLESSLYFLATNPADPMLVFAAATLGQLFRSDDGGETWQALGRRLPEIRAMAWLPD